MRGGGGDGYVERLFVDLATLQSNSPLGLRKWECVGVYGVEVVLATLDDINRLLERPGSRTKCSLDGDIIEQALLD